MAKVKKVLSKSKPKVKPKPKRPAVRTSVPTKPKPKPKPLPVDAVACAVFTDAPVVPAPPSEGKWRLFWNNDKTGGAGWDWENVV